MGLENSCLHIEKSGKMLEKMNSMLYSSANLSQLTMTASMQNQSKPAS